MKPRNVTSLSRTHQKYVNDRNNVDRPKNTTGEVKVNIEVKVKDQTREQVMLLNRVKVRVKAKVDGHMMSRVLLKVKDKVLKYYGTVPGRRKISRQIGRI